MTRRTPEEILEWEAVRQGRNALEMPSCGVPTPSSRGTWSPTSVMLLEHREGAACRGRIRMDCLRH
jgi:hypothetical protein